MPCRREGWLPAGFLDTRLFNPAPETASSQAKCSPPSAQPSQQLQPNPTPLKMCVSPVYIPALQWCWQQHRQRHRQRGGELRGESGGHVGEPRKRPGIDPWADSCLTSLNSVCLRDPRSATVFGDLARQTLVSGHVSSERKTGLREGRASPPTFSEVNNTLSQGRHLKGDRLAAKSSLLDRHKEWLGHIYDRGEGHWRSIRGGGDRRVQAGLPG